MTNPINLGFDLDAIAAANAELLAARTPATQAETSSLPFDMDPEADLIYPITGYLVAQRREGDKVSSRLKVVFNDIPGLFQNPPAPSHQGKRCLNVPFSSNNAFGNSGAHNAFNVLFKAREEASAQAEEQASPAVAGATSTTEPGF